MQRWYRRWFPGSASQRAPVVRQAQVPRGPSNLAIAIAVNAALFSLTFLLVTLTYETNDDVVMMMYASGLLGGQPSEYLVFINILIGKLLALLYWHAPGVNWYTVFFLASHFTAMVALAYAFLSRGRRLVSLLFFILLFAFFEVRLLARLQFTTTACVLLMSGFLLFATSPRTPGRRPWALFVLAAILVTAGGLVRMRAFYLVMLLAAPLLVARFLETKSTRIPVFLTAACVLFFAGRLCDRRAYAHDPRWASYGEYNDVRSRIHGQPLEGDLEAAYEQVGWSRNDAAMFFGWFFADERVYSKEKLEAIAALRGPRSTHEAASLLWRIARKRDVRVFVGLTLLAVGGAVLLASRKTRLLVLGTAVEALLVVVYLAYASRVPARVYMPMLFFLSSVSMIRLAQDRTWVRVPFPRAVRWASILLVAACCGLGFRHSRRNEKVLAAREMHDQLLATISPRGSEVFVLWEFPYECISPFTTFEQYRKHGFRFLPVGWMLHSPHDQKLRSEFGMRDVFASLYERTNVFVVSCSPGCAEILRQYIREHHHQEVRLQIRCRIGDPGSRGEYVCYKVERAAR